MSMIWQAKITGLAIVAGFALASLATGQTVRTNTLESLRTTYSNAVAKIADDTQKQKDDALLQYGRNLGAVLASLKQKGDIDGYTVVDQEAKRFQADKTILTNAPPAQVAPAVAVYLKQVQTSDTDLIRRRSALLKQYILALNGLVKDLMAKDKIKDAKAAGEARRSAESMLAEAESGQSPAAPSTVNSFEPPPVKASPVSPVSTATPPNVPDEPVTIIGGLTILPLSGQELTLTGTQTNEIRELGMQKQPYVLRGVYVVPAGKELHFAAGSLVVAEKGALLSVSGKLNVAGAVDTPVVFKGKATGSCFWKGITLQNSIGSTVIGTHVSGAETGIEVVGQSSVSIAESTFTGNECALRITGGKNRVENCLVTENKKTAIETGSVELDLVRCTVADNGGTGLFHVWAGPVHIESCVFTGNKEGGIRTRSDLEAHNCILTGNQKYDVFNDACYGKQDRDFAANWWGVQSTQLLTQKGDTTDLPNILDGHDDTKSGLVHLERFLLKKPVDCGISQHKPQAEVVRPSVAQESPRSSTQTESSVNSLTNNKAVEVPSEVGTDGTLIYRGHRYKFMDKPGVTYAQSVAACEELGGHLVTINSPAEWTWINKTFLSGDPDKAFRTIYLGVALPDKRWWTDTDTKWIDGERFDTKKADWAGGHPWDHRDGSGYRFRWIMTYQGHWATVGSSDDRVNGYICEWDLMAKDKIAKAKAAGYEKKEAEFLLEDIEAALPMVVQTNVVASVASETLSSGRLFTDVVGVWKVDYDNGNWRTINIDENGHVKVVEASWPCVGITFDMKWDSGAKKYVVLATDQGNAETYSLDSGKLLVERWFGSQYLNGQQLNRGTGKRISTRIRGKKL